MLSPKVADSIPDEVMSQPYGPPRPVRGIALHFLTFLWSQDNLVGIAIGYGLDD
jgi:hypothetical protein